jgi:hypothetical protein
VGLIARELEAAGISTVVISMMRDILYRVKPPRGVFVNFPIGHSLGRPSDKTFQMHIIKDALSVLNEAKIPGKITDLPYRWSDDFSWQYWPRALVSYIDKRKSKLSEQTIWSDAAGVTHRKMEYPWPVPGWIDDWSGK